jgi:hypothetical protein
MKGKKRKEVSETETEIIPVEKKARKEYARVPVDGVQFSASIVNSLQASKTGLFKTQFINDIKAIGPFATLGPVSTILTKTRQYGYDLLKGSKTREIFGKEMKLMDIIVEKCAGEELLFLCETEGKKSFVLVDCAKNILYDDELEHDQEVSKEGFEAFGITHIKCARLIKKRGSRPPLGF